MAGFLNVDKPAGMTSHDVVVAVRRRLPRRTKVGHAGTLDPFATGVLVLGIERAATRRLALVQQQTKRYHAQITLGATSTTDDPEGDIQEVAAAVPPSQEELQQALERFVGEIEQVPPAHSAVHVDGRRAYELARQGRAPELPPRRVTIHAIELLEYAWPTLTLDVRCGTGTYIRALARDLGEALGVGGYCSALRRTAVGPFTSESAVPLKEVNLARDVIPVDKALTLLKEDSG
jgi:tRNA pseudouridine55 synthase